MFHATTNPLRRAADRTRLRWHAALVVSLLVAVAAGVLSAMAAWNAESRAARAETAHRHSITATTLTPAERGLGARVGGITDATAQAAWQFPAATRHTDRIAVPAGTPTGKPVRVWVDDAGEEAQAPRSGSEITFAAVTAGAWTGGLIALISAGGVHFALRLVEARSLTQWERDWERVEPRWSGRLRSGPGGTDDD